MLRWNGERSVGVRWLAICLVLLATIQASAREGGKVRTTKLTLGATAPAEAPTALRLTLAPAETTEGDACPLYEKAAELLPANLDSQKISDLLRAPLEELPLEDVESLLRQCRPAMEQFRRAAACKSCDWPWVEAESMCPSSDQWRHLTFLLGLQIHHQLARRQYALAAETLRVGFAAANHLGHGPTMMYGIMATGAAGRMCREVELFVEQPGAPSLLTALEGLPLPFISLEEQMESEGIPSNDSLHKRIELLTDRVDRHIASLRCIEALRLHATEHDGTFPETLRQMSNVTIPLDPARGKPFIYRRGGDGAVLEAPAGDGAQETVRFELAFQHD